MKVWGVSAEQVHTRALALDMKVSNLRREGKAIAFKLDASGSNGFYARRSAPMGREKGRRLTALCYHGWRDFIEALFKVDGATRVQTSQGNWLEVETFRSDLQKLGDQNVGSGMNPARMIDLCTQDHTAIDVQADDHEVQFSKGEVIDGEIVFTDTRMIKQSDIGKCPHVIFVPEHYREDGSCKCDDLEERRMMIRDWEYEPEMFDGIPLRGPYHPHVSTIACGKDCID